MDIEFLIPDNINIEELIPADLKGQARNKFHDRALYIIHLIITRLNTKKVFEKYLAEGYIRLMKKYLQNIMGKQTDLVIRVLKTKGVIEIDHDYEVGQYSKGYILTPKYRISTFKKVKPISYQVTKIYKNNQDKIKKAQRKLELKIPKVLAQLSEPWSIDLEKALHWIEKFEEMFYHQVKASTSIPAKNKSEIISKYKQYLLYIRYQLTMIEQGNTKEYIIDNKAGRLHTIFTGLPRPLKNFLIMKDEGLCSIDIKNSQPFLLGYMTTPRFWKTTQEGKKEERAKEALTLMKIGQDIHKEILKNSSWKDERSAIIKIVKTSEILTGKDFKELHLQCVHLRQLVSDGGFYEHIMKNFQNRYISGGVDRFGSRQATKQEVMRIMYFDARKKNAPFYAPFKQFEEVFTIAARIMTLIKRSGGKNGYKEFPVLLQKLESKLMLEKVGEKMPKHIPFLTIHDSLILPATGVQSAINLIEKEFEYYLDMKPRISAPELLTPDKGFEALDGYVQEKLTNLEVRFINKQKVINDDIIDE